MNGSNTLKLSGSCEKTAMLLSSALAKKIHLAMLMEVIANPALSQTSKHKEIDRIFQFEQAARQEEKWPPLKPLYKPTLAK